MSLDPREVLGVSASATDAEIKVAFKKRAKKYHPDAGGDAWAFRLIVEAYEKLLGGTTGGSSSSAPRTAKANSTYSDDGLGDVTFKMNKAQRSFNLSFGKQTEELTFREDHIQFGAEIVHYRTVTGYDFGFEQQSEWFTSTMSVSLSLHAGGTARVATVEASTLSLVGSQRHGLELLTVLQLLAGSRIVPSILGRIFERWANEPVEIPHTGVYVSSSGISWEERRLLRKSVVHEIPWDNLLGVCYTPEIEEMAYPTRYHFVEDNGSLASVKPTLPLSVQNTTSLFTVPRTPYNWDVIPIVVAEGVMRFSNRAYCSILDDVIR